LFGAIGYSFLHIRRDWSKFNTHYFAADAGELAGLAARVATLAARLDHLHTALATPAHAAS